MPQNAIATGHPVPYFDSMGLLKTIYRTVVPGPVRRARATVQVALAYLRNGAPTTNMRSGLVQRRVPVDSAIIERILAAYLAAKKDQPSAPAVYQPTGAWSDVEMSRSELATAARNRDVPRLGALMQELFRSSLMGGLQSQSTYRRLLSAGWFERARFVNSLLHDHRRWHALRLPNSVLVAPRVGNPWGYFINDVLLVPDACRHQYYTTKIAALLPRQGRPSVVELGGGYGGMAYYLLRAGRDLRYTDYDLPEVLFCASFVLLSSFPNLRFRLYGEPGDASADVTMLPNFVLPAAANRSADLFFNSASLSEMGRATVEEYVAQMCRVTSGVIFHDNSRAPALLSHNHTEVAADDFPFTNDFTLLEREQSWFGGTNDRCWEHVYRRKSGPGAPSVE